MNLKTLHTSASELALLTSKIIEAETVSDVGAFARSIEALWGKQALRQRVGAVHIGRWIYESRASAKREYLEVLRNAEHDQPLVGEEDDLARGLFYLLPGHEQKIGCGVSHVEVREVTRGTVTFFVVRVDGTSEPFWPRHALAEAPTVGPPSSRWDNHTVGCRIGPYYFVSCLVAVRISSEVIKCSEFNQPLVDHVDNLVRHMYELLPARVPRTCRDVSHFEVGFDPSGRPSFVAVLKNGIRKYFHGTQAIANAPKVIVPWKTWPGPGE